MREIVSVNTHFTDGRGPPHGFYHECVDAMRTDPGSGIMYLYIAEVVMCSKRRKKRGTNSDYILTG